jgi:GNAT superfamily N-acetyltransferase
VFVAIDGDEIVGFASCGPARDTDDVPAVEGAGELEAIYLLPSAWRQGVGGQLHGSVVDHLTAAGFPVATLWVLEANAPARRFYERHAWSSDGTTQLYQGAPELRYRRPLS